MRDFAFAARALRNSPVFAVTAIITIALGIGASAAIFSVTNAVLLRPLPYKDSNRLVFVCTDMTKRHVRDFAFSNANFIDLRNEAKTMFDGFAAVQTFPQLLEREDGTPEQIQSAAVSINFFQLMGARIVRGRDFQESDGLPQAPPPPGGAAAGAPAPPPVPNSAILSYEYWQRRYGGNNDVLGSVMKTGGGGGPVIVGVLQPGFTMLAPPSLNLERVPNVWIAARIAYDEANRKNVQWQAVGRLKPGVPLEQAQAEVDAVAAQTWKIDPIFATAGYALRLEPMKKYLVEQVRPAILALMGAVIFLLLIACANVANLLLVRASLRERELAVRTALGGSRWRLVRQMLTEALLLAGAGTLVGLGLAWVGIRELLAIAPADLPRLDSVAIDPVVVAFTALAGFAAAALFGLTPALRASRPDVMQILRSSGRTSGLGGGRILRGGVVVAEVALSFVLLIGSGLMFRSFLALQHIDTGYDANGLLTFQLQGTFQGRPKQEQRAAIQRELQEALRALPGVQSVAAALPFPLTGGYSPIRWGLEPAATDPSKFQAADVLFVLPGYFATMRTPLLDGRTFTEADNDPKRNLAIIDDILARKAYPHESAVGRRLLIRARTPEPEWVEIIGVVRHERGSSLAEPGREQMYFTDAFIGSGVAGTWALRSGGDPALLAGPVRAAIAKIDPHLLITEMQPMSAIVEKAQSGTRFSLLLIGVFAVIAALLAGVGLYGVLSTVVRERTAEIGVRMTIGALPADIFQLMVGHVARLTAIGIGVGLVAALLLTRAMVSLLVGVKATDPVTYAAMVVLFFMIAALAAWLPARRAAGLDPTVALREE
ncbi:MAG TPA: ABC transporter permease [Candidatus Acidoferrales bacterium]|nr:ABC transporter permease [Candidatus Acidoferrales bacterium]